MPRKNINQFFVPSGTQEEKINIMLQQLDLNSMSSYFQEANRKTFELQGTHLDFFERVIEQEVLRREENRINSWMQYAHFPARKSLQDFDFTFQPSINKSQINELASCRFIKEGSNILFFGPAGVGKTHLSIALGMQAIISGFKTRFLKLDELILLIERQEDDTTLLRSLMSYPLLILDDIDYYDTGRNASTVLFKLIRQRHEQNLSMIFTSNKKYSEWKDLFGTRERANAAIDRIVERAEVVNITGKSFRQDRAEKRLKEAKKHK
jgi:DNA replication protein DnaC